MQKKAYFARVYVSPATESADGEAPVLKEYESEISVIEGQQAILRVEVTGVPQPTITWRSGDKIVEPDYAIEIAKDGALCFVSVEMCHAGSYHFTARNTSGSVEGKVDLRVREEEEGNEGGWISERKPGPVTKPVPVDQFGEHVAQLHANNNVGFFRQYQVCLRHKVPQLPPSLPLSISSLTLLSLYSRILGWRQEGEALYYFLFVSVVFCYDRVCHLVKKDIVWLSSSCPVTYPRTDSGTSLSVRNTLTPHSHLKIQP